MMNEKHKSICEKYIRFWHQLKFAGSMYAIPLEGAKELETVLREHLNSKEPVCLWCGEGQMYLIKQVYQAYERDAENPMLNSTLKTVIEYPNGKPLTDPSQSVPFTPCKPGGVPDPNFVPVEIATVTDESVKTEPSIVAAQSKRGRKKK